MTSHFDAAMGDGTFVGELREGPDGRIYEWTEGVDGFGERVGFWQAQRVLKSIARTARARARSRRRRRMARRRTALGSGSYAGELRRGPDGTLFEWVEGIDGLGAPIGFWKAVKAVGRGVGKAAGRIVGTAGKAVGSAARRYLPTAAQMALPGVGPAAAEAIRWAQGAGLLGDEDHEDT